MAKKDIKKKKVVRHDKKFHRHVIIFIGILATIVAIIISQIGFFNGLESKTVDWRFKERGARKPSAPVIIVAIDDSSFTNMPERWLWPRNFYAQAVTNLKAWGAKVIAFDVIYSEATARNVREDAEFAAAVRQAGNVISGMAILVENTAVGQSVRYVYPLPELRASSYALGVVHHPFDRDTYIRHSDLVKVDPDSGAKLLSLGLQSYGLYKGLNVRDLKINKEDNTIQWGDINSPNRIFLNYAGPVKTFTTVPFYQVYFGAGMDKSMFKDKIVLIGSTADILHDVFNTPYTEGGNNMPGVEIHANVIDNLYNNNRMRPMEKLESFLLVLAIGVLTSFMIFGIKSLKGLIVVAVELVVYTVAACYLFDNYNYVIDMVNPFFTIILCYLSITAYKVGVEENENRKIKNLFSKYVSKTLVNEILKHTELKLGGEKKVVSVLFSDIRGFTAMSETMQPQEVLGVLNEYLTAMVDVVFANGGTLDKFVGDAVMAVYGSPLEEKEHALKAVRSGWQMLQRLEKLNEKWTKEGKKTLKIGIGINSGDVVAGNMGSLQRMEYTVIGDTVNLASRLESLNKELSTEFIISGATYELVRDHVNVKRYDGIKIKGKVDSMSVYEVLGLV
jgi:adenylate cyclase